ncbi:hypothetical protein A7X67_01500 [Clostridium sp. W14A]|nr:hypothetical protein A7X67_01500 [Clostridium sp. W14A]
MLNVSVLMGRMVSDPELKHTPKGVAVSTFSIAVDRDYKKEGQNRETDFLDVVCWRHNAEYACKYFRKGQLIAVKGSIQTRTYTDTNGDKRKAVEIVADDVYAASFPKKDTEKANAEQ